MALSLSLINPTRGSVATSRSVCVVDGAAFAGSERQGTEVLGSTGGAVWMEASVPLWSDVRRSTRPMPFHSGTHRSDLTKAVNTKSDQPVSYYGHSSSPASTRRGSPCSEGPLKSLPRGARDRTTRAGPLYGKSVRFCDSMTQAGFGGKSCALGFLWQLAKDCLVRRAS